MWWTMLNKKYRRVYFASIVFLSTLSCFRQCFKGTVSWDKFQRVWRQCTELGPNKGRGWFSNCPEAPLTWKWLVTSSFLLMLKSRPQLMLSEKFCNWTPGKSFPPVQCRFMSDQSEAASVLCKPIGTKLWPSTSSRPTINKKTEFCRIVICTLENIYWRTDSLIQDFMEHAEPTLTFLNWYQY
jgi:hypothetical protein